MSGSDTPTGVDASEATTSEVSSTTVSASVEGSGDFDSLWGEVTRRMEAAVQVETEQEDDAEDAQRWDQLESWLLKDQTARIRALAMQVARMELMLRTWSQKFDARFEASFSSWQRHFDERLEAMLRRRVSVSIEHQVAAHIEAHAADIKNQVIASIQADLDARIEAALPEHLITLRNQLRVDVQSEIGEAIDVHLDAKLLRLRARLVSEITRDIDEVIRARVSEETRNIDIDIDLTGIREELRVVLDQVARVENDLVLRIDGGDNALREWVVAQLLMIKSHMTDRDSLTELMLSFTTRLRERLDASVCVQPAHWAEVSPTFGYGGSGSGTDEIDVDLSAPEVSVHVRAEPDEEAPAEVEEPGEEAPAEEEEEASEVTETLTGAGAESASIEVSTDARSVTRTGDGVPVEELPGITEAQVEALQSEDIWYTNELLARCATTTARRRLSLDVDVDGGLLLSWANWSDLLRSDRIGPRMARALELAGVDTIPELARRNPTNLHAKLTQVLAEQDLGLAPMSVEALTALVESAGALGRALEYRVYSSSDDEE